MPDPFDKLGWLGRLGENAPGLFATLACVCLFLYYLDQWTGIAINAQAKGVEALGQMSSAIAKLSEVTRQVAEQQRADMDRREREHERIMQLLENSESNHPR